jgi:hypothetical protein
MAENSTTRSITGNLAGSAPDGLLIAGSPEAITPLGTSQSTAAPITKAFAVVTGADGTLAVTLPVISAAGQVQAIYNATATNGLPVFPNTGASINGGTVDSGSIAMEGKTLAILIATSTTNWSAIFTAN